MAGQPATVVDVRIGARIFEARRAARLTQRQVGAALGMSAAQLQKYEKGTNRISAVALSIVAAMTGRPIASFFDEPHALGERPSSDLTVAQARDALRAAAETYFETKQRHGSTGGSVIAFVAEAA